MPPSAVASRNHLVQRDAVHRCAWPVIRNADAVGERKAFPLHVGQARAGSWRRPSARALHRRAAGRSRMVMAALRSVSSKPGKCVLSLRSPGRLQPDPQAGRKHRLGAGGGSQDRQSGPGREQGDSTIGGAWRRTAFQIAAVGRRLPNRPRPVAAMARLTLMRTWPRRLAHGRAREFVTGWLAGRGRPSYMSQ